MICDSRGSVFAEYVVVLVLLSLGLVSATAALGPRFVRAALRAEARLLQPQL